MFAKYRQFQLYKGKKGGMRNPTSRHLQTPKPLSTFQSDLSDAGHNESALRHALLSPLTFQIISAIMVARSALAVVTISEIKQKSVKCKPAESVDIIIGQKLKDCEGDTSDGNISPVDK